MEKSKRSFSVLSKTLVFIMILALCLFGFSVSRAFAEDENESDAPVDEKVLAEKLSGMDNLWKVEKRSTATGGDTSTDEETSAVAEEYSPAEFLSYVDYVDDGDFREGDRKSYYVYYIANNEYKVSLNTSVVIEDGKMLADYFDVDNIVYENDTATGFSGMFRDFTTTATLTLKAQGDGTTTAASKTVTLAKEWAIVTPHLSYVNSGTTDEKFTPIRTNPSLTYGDDFENIGFNVPVFAEGYGVDSPISIDLQVQYYKPDMEPTGYGLFGLEIKDGEISEKGAAEDDEYDFAAALKDLITQEHDNGAKNTAGYYVFTMKPIFDGAAPTQAVKDGVTYLIVSESTATFEIKPYDLSESDKITATANNGTYDHGNAVTPGMTIKFGDKTLAEGKDYSLEYEGNTEYNTEAVVTATGIGNFCGSIEKQFSIGKANNRIDQLTIQPWDFGNFDESKNAITISNVTYAPETARYTVCKLVEDDSNPDNIVYFEQEISETLTGFTLEDGNYKEAVVKELEKLPVGNYVLKAMIPEADNWYECEYAGQNTSYQGGWRFDVNRAVFTDPALPSGVTYEYNGNKIMLPVTGYNGIAMTASVTSEKDYEFDSENGILSAVDAGTYTITLAITDSGNCSFASGEESVTLTWTISPRVVTSPKADETRFTINGKNQYYNPIGFDSSIMQIEGNVRDNSGASVVIVSLKDKENYVWDSGDTDDITFAWYIDTADTEFAIAVSVLVCLIAVGIAVAVMQYINHRQRLTVFAEVGGQNTDKAEESSATEETEQSEENNADADEPSAESDTTDNGVSEGGDEQ